MLIYVVIAIVLVTIVFLWMDYQDVSLQVDVSFDSLRSSEAKLRSRLFARVLDSQPSDSNSINRSHNSSRSSGNAWCQDASLFVVDGDFFAGMNIAQAKNNTWPYKFFM